MRIAPVKAGAYNQRIMEYQVFVQNVAEKNFVATIVGFPDCRAEGQTEEEAVAQAKAALSARLSHGKFVKITVEESAQLAAHNPLLKHAGRFKDDPTFDAVMEEIAKYRRELDAEEILP